MKGFTSLLLFMVLVICGVWLYIKGMLYKFFNGNSTLYHIAYELDHEPLFRYGILILYFLSLLLFFFEYKKGWKKIRITLLFISSLLVVPIYTHVVINEYKMETAPVNNRILKDYKKVSDYAVIEDFSYEDESKIVYVTLDYGTDKNLLLDEYFEDGEPLTEVKERSLKRSLHYDMGFIINSVWSSSHQPKQIIFDVKWGKGVLLTITANKRERFLSYFDSDENDEFISIYEYIDVTMENGNYVIKLKNNNGNWVNVALK